MSVPPDPARLIDKAEVAVTALLPLLPLQGSWQQGYRVTDTVQSTLSAMPEEWANAAHAIAELHAALAAAPPSPPLIEALEAAPDCPPTDKEYYDWFTGIRLAALAAARGETREEPRDA